MKTAATKKRATKKVTGRTAPARTRSTTARLRDPWVGIIMISTGKGGCDVEKTSRVVASRGGPVRWDVSASCGHVHNVEVVFNGADDPLEPCKRETSVPPDGKIKCKVKRAAAEKVYNYRVRIDGTTVDPELEVNPPVLIPKPPKPGRGTIKSTIPLGGGRRPKPRRRAVSANRSNRA